MRPVMAVLAILVVSAGTATAKTSLSGAFDLAAGKFGEIDFDLAEGAPVTYSWSTTPAASLHFNVHTHENGVVKEYQPVDAEQGSGSYTATSTTPHSLLWENNGPGPTKVTFSLAGPLTCTASVPDGLCSMASPAGGAIPGAGLQAVVVAALVCAGSLRLAHRRG